MSDRHDTVALIEYKIEHAKIMRDDADFLMQNGRLVSAVNRIYYTMFHLLEALALRHGYHTSKHKQLIGWFNKTFVKEGIIPPKYSKILTEAFENRSESDYGLFAHFTQDEVDEMYTEMEDFFNTIENFILSGDDI